MVQISELAESVGLSRATLLYYEKLGLLKVPPVGSTVEGAEFSNTLGAAAMGGYWVDPEFDPAQRAYYYVRVLEIPTPSWLAYDQAFYGNIDLPDDAVMVQQERAYTSPIWYSPAG